MILSELTLSQRHPNTTNQRQRTVTSVECPSEGQGLQRLQLHWVKILYDIYCLMLLNTRKVVHLMIAGFC
jgi:hypothetical protein